MPINIVSNRDTDKNLNIQGDLLFSPERSGNFLLENSPWFPTFPGLSPSGAYTTGQTINQPYITTQNRSGITINGSNGAYVTAVNIDFGKHSETNTSDLFRNNHSAKVALTIIKNSQTPNPLPHQYVFNVLVNRTSSTTFQTERFDIVNNTTILNNGSAGASYSYLNAYDTTNQIYELRVRSSSGTANLSNMNIKAIIYVNT